VTTIGLNCLYHHGRRAAFQTRKGLHKRNRQADTRGSRYCQGNESLDGGSTQSLTPRALGKCDGSTGEAIIPRKAHTAGQILDVPEWQSSLSHTSSLTGIRSRFNLKITGRHNHNIERIRRLGTSERADTVALEETWPAQTGYDEDGSGSHVLYQRSTQLRKEAVAD